MKLPYLINKILEISFFWENNPQKKCLFNNLLMYFFYLIFIFININDKLI